MSIHCRPSAELNLRSVAGKNSRKPFSEPRRDIKHQLTHPFAIASDSSLIG